MKIKEKTEPIFKPLTIEITLESPEEIHALAAILNPGSLLWVNYYESDDRYNDVTCEEINNVKSPIWDILDIHDKPY